MSLSSHALEAAARSAVTWPAGYGAVWFIDSILISAWSLIFARSTAPLGKSLPRSSRTSNE